MPCPDCNNHCNSLNQCTKYREFNDLVAQAKRIAALKKHIQVCVPHFQGKRSWLENDSIQKSCYNRCYFDKSTIYKYRFLSITFDPAKFSFNELSNPVKLHNYALCAINDIKHLFRGNIILIREYQKSGVAHYHLNYDTYDSDTLEHIKIRLRYYFSKNLRNKYAVHDRIFNAGGVEYLQKDNQTYFEFKFPDKTLEILENNLFSEV